MRPKWRITVPVACAAVSVALLATAGILYAVAPESGGNDSGGNDSGGNDSAAPAIRPPDQSGGLYPVVPTQIRDAGTEPRRTVSATDDPPGAAALLAGTGDRNPYVVTSAGQYRRLPELAEAADGWEGVTVRLFPDGSQVAYAGDTTVVVLDLTTGKSTTLMTASDADAGIDVLAVSPDGRRLLVAAGDDALLLDVTTRDRTALDGPDSGAPSGGPTAGAFSRNGQQVALSYRDDEGGTLVAVRQVRDGTGHTARYDGVATLAGPGAFSPDGRSLLLARPSYGDVNAVEVVSAAETEADPSPRRVRLGAGQATVSNVVWRTEDTLLVNETTGGGLKTVTRLSVVGLDGATRETVTTGADAFEVAARIAPRVRGGTVPRQPPDVRRDTSTGEPDTVVLLIALIAVVLAGLVGAAGVVVAVVGRLRVVPGR
jgi:hypothetical protein